MPTTGDIYVFRRLSRRLVLLCRFHVHCSQQKVFEGMQSDLFYFWISPTEESSLGQEVRNELRRVEVATPGQGPRGNNFHSTPNGISHTAIEMLSST